MLSMQYPARVERDSLYNKKKLLRISCKSTFTYIFTHVKHLLFLLFYSNFIFSFSPTSVDIPLDR